MRWRVAFIVALIALVVVGCWYYINVVPMQSEISSLSEELKSLDTKIAELDSDSATDIARLSLELGNFDLNKFTEESGLLVKYCEEHTVWSNSSEFAKVRDEVLETAGGSYFVDSVFNQDVVRDGIDGIYLINVVPLPLDSGAYLVLLEMGNDTTPNLAHWAAVEASLDEQGDIAFTNSYIITG